LKLLDSLLKLKPVIRYKETKDKYNYNDKSQQYYFSPEVLYSTLPLALYDFSKYMSFLSARREEAGSTPKAGNADVESTKYAKYDTAHVLEKAVRKQNFWEFLRYKYEKNEAPPRKGGPKVMDQYYRMDLWELMQSPVVFFPIFLAIFDIICRQHQDLITPDDKAKLKKIFDEMDADGSKHLDIDEVRKFLQDNLDTGDQVEKMFTLVDLNKTGTIDFQEFTFLMSPEMDKIQNWTRKNLRNYDEKGIIKQSSNMQDILKSQTYIKKHKSNPSSESMPLSAKNSQTQMVRNQLQGKNLVLQNLFQCAGKQFVDANKMIKELRNRDPLKEVYGTKFRTPHPDKIAKWMDAYPCAGNFLGCVPISLLTGYFVLEYPY
jgi:hypothetical protein